MTGTIPSISDYYRGAIERIKEEVEEQDDAYILSVNEEKYAKYLFEKCALPEIIFDKTRKSCMEDVLCRRQVESAGEIGIVEDLLIHIRLPVIPHEKIGRVLKLRASRWTGRPLNMRYHDGLIIIETPANESEVERAKRQIKQEVDWRNADIRHEDEQMKKDIRTIIASRKKKIQNRDQLLERISRKVGIPLKRREDAASIVAPSLEVKEKIRSIMPPKATPPIELRLSKQQFDAIIKLVDNCSRMFEQTPGTFSKLKEEELRDVVLSNLNGVFQGEAVGEAFAKSGRTDIYLQITKGGIFKAECKYWHGPKTLDGAVAQILGYLTWRDSYGVVIVFSRNKGFSDVLEATAKAVPESSSYVSEFQRLNETHFKATHHLPEDEKKLVEIHYLLYNLYAEPKTRT